LQLEILTIIISVIVAPVTVLWYASEFFFFKNYVQVIIIMHHTNKGNLRIIIHNNGNKSVRFDEIGIYLLGTFTPIKDVNFKGNEISPLKPFKLILYSESFQHLVDEKLTFANKTYKPFLREDFCEFRFYIKTSNKYRLTKIWLSIDDVFPKAGDGLLDNAIETSNKRVDFKYTTDVGNVMSTSLVMMAWIMFLTIAALLLDPEVTLFLLVTTFPIILICPITYSNTKKGLWAKQHVRISITSLIILTISLGAICYFTLNLSENMEFMIICMFILILYPPVLMTLSYMQSVSLKSAMKKYGSRKYNFKERINGDEESDSQ